MADIILIDDDAAVRASVRRLLEAGGHTVREASDGAAGERLHASRPADLVVTDLFMPGQEGIETIRSLRRGDPGLPILAISGGTATVDPKALLAVAEKLGADRALSKPFDRVELLGVVDGLLG